MRLFNKWFFLLSLAILAAVPVNAEPVPEGRALEAARAFFRNDDNRALRMAPLQRLEWNRAPLVKAGASDPAYHIFNRAGGGFVIIAGDDACAPVLAYSFTGRFCVGDDMPEGLRDWMDELEELVAIAREDGEPSRRVFAGEWNELFVPTKATVGGFKPAIKHRTPSWGQRTPFNDLAPMINGKRAVAGCVPLAMSMLCKFYEYPAKGKGSLPSYTYEPESGGSQTISGYELGHTYNWAKMKMEYKSYTDEEAAAVAQLVYDCGVMAQVSFDSSTAGNINTMARKVIEYFGFDASAVGVSRNYYTDEKWLELIKTELQEHPVLYSGRSEDSGHAFLIDGYDTNGYLSVNWGWSGDSNGYFRLDAFTPGSNHKYIYKHAAILGLKPDAGGKVQEYLYLLSGTSSSGVEYHGLEATSPIVPRQDFSMKLGGICNGGNEMFEGYFILALCDADGNIKDFVSGSQYYASTQPRHWRGYTGIVCILNRYPEQGDIIKAFYRSSSWPDDDWREFLYDRTDGTTDSVPINDGQTLAEATNISYTTTLGELTVETKDYVDWSLTNAAGASMADYVTYSVTTMTIREKDLPKGTYKLELRRGSEQLAIDLKMGKK